ncbi:protein kinase [Streptomyces sp. NPDC021020]|uniref:protein kinase domain-containing protein n=1 Tax=Streptomyces sp. NPDC021020 TaxID=3365109 RepID=UPI0037ABD31C
MTEADTSHRIGPETEPDRYRLVRSIGRGGEALLYLAELELAGETEPVVLKIFDTAATVTEEEFTRIGRRWKEQAELLRFVHRPGVVGVREYFEAQPVHRSGEVAAVSGRALVLVLNYVDGLDLRDWRAGHDFASAQDWREVASVLAQLAETLDFLHSGLATPSRRLVVHGDLSPGNVMVDDRGQTTLVDFGLSKLTAEGSTAQVWFTPGYAAPEVFEGKRTPATDRYAFGGIAYFLLSGQAPPIAPDQLAQALGGLPQFAALPADTRERLCAIAAADPDRRPADLSSWVAALRQSVVSTGPSQQATLRAAPPVPSAPPPSAYPAAPGTLPQPTEPYRPGTPHPPAPVPPAPRGRRPALPAFSVLAALIVVSLVVYLVANRGSGGDESAKGGDIPRTGSSGPANPAASSAPAGTPTTAPTTQPPSPTLPPTLSLTELQPVAKDADGSLRTGSGTIDTKHYDTALVVDQGPEARCQGSISYNLARDWNRLTMVAGIDDDSFDTAAVVTIYVDNQQLYTSQVDVGDPASIDLEVTGVLRLTIVFTDTEPNPHCRMGDLVLGAPTLSR